MNRFILIIVLCCFAGVVNFSSAAPVNDSTLNFSERSFDASQLKEWRADRNFIYERKISASISLWDIIGNWINRLFSKIFSTVAGTWSFWTIVLLISVAIILFFIVRYKAKTSDLFSRKNQRIGFEEINEDIHSIDFPEQISNALNEHNYRLAIRLQYLYLLKFLSDKELIRWYAGKTNDEYVKEIRMQNNESLHNSFKGISRLFDYVWYGEFKTSKEDYDESAQLAQQTKNECKYMTNKKETALA